TRATRAPDGTSSDTPASARCRPNRLVKPSSSIRMGHLGEDLRLDARPRVGEDERRREQRGEAPGDVGEPERGLAAEEAQVGIAGDELGGQAAELVGHVAHTVAVEVVTGVVVEVVALEDGPLGLAVAVGADVAVVPGEDVAAKDVAVAGAEEG